jgi:subtilisin family serine protease
MNVLDLVGLTALMERTAGKPEVVVGLIDGPIAMSHPDLTGDTIREVPGKTSATSTRSNSAACLHGTFVAGILSAKRGSAGPAICPSCTLLAYPIFGETPSQNTQMPSATPEELTTAILACIDAGARILNLSLALTQTFTKGDRALGEALDHAAGRGVIIVAAAGNQSTIGSTVITSHPWVIPVAACDSLGRPTQESNLGNSLGRRGLRAPGQAITSLGAEGHPMTLGGTSVATPFVSGAIALIWSEFPTAIAAELKAAIAQSFAGRRTTVTPPLLNACVAHAYMNSHMRRYVS